MGGYFNSIGTDQSPAPEDSFDVVFSEQILDTLSVLVHDAIFKGVGGFYIESRIANSDTKVL